MGPETILMGLGGVGIVGVLAIFLPKLLGRSKKSKLLDQFKKDEKQKRLQDEIKKKLQKAAVEIQETLKEDSLSAIDDQIDSDWEGI